MRIILLKDVKKLGKKDEIVDVKDGYGKFLLNNKDAVVYTSKSKEVLKDEIKKRNEEEELIIKNCEKVKKQLQKEKLTFQVKIGDNGKLFGSVSTKQIHEELIKLGYEIDKKKIKINMDINTVGIYDVEISLHKKVKATIQVNVKSK